MPNIKNIIAIAKCLFDLKNASRVVELEAELAKLKDWSAEKKKYKLTAIREDGGICPQAGVCGFRATVRATALDLLPML